MELEKLSLNGVLEISDINEKYNDKNIKIRGFVQNIKIKKKLAFLVLREGSHTLQCIGGLDESGLDENQFESLKKVTLESYIEVYGTSKEVKNKIKACTVKLSELWILDFDILSKAEAVLPFSYKDAASTLHERENNKALATVAYNLCLDNRSLYLRTPQGLAFTRILDGIMFGFRDYLRKHGFVEIKSPKLIECASEGGANVFSVDYFKRKAFLAQSPQLYKQMAIIGGLRKVYEIGHVYRAEESNINRYLSEFIGLDLEMEIKTDYSEVINFIYKVLLNIFEILEKEYSEELEKIQKYFPFEKFLFTQDPVILTHRECVDLLKEKGMEIGYEDDFNNENEKTLGKLVKEKYKTDIFIAKDYPVSARPFYTSVDPTTNLTRSYDFIVRGEEILSGAQRINKYEDLLKNVQKNNIRVDSLGGYLEAFKFGAPPHGGCGIGLERLTKAYFGMSDIRYFSLFPRDPKRLYP